ncbi:MAG: hypothetical protein FJ291_10310 [Planctomycetes bacterium]|nr:hypothetical protein [Planctomycetota bacterium]
MAQEEGFCFNCHDGSPAPNVYADFSKARRHPVANSEQAAGRKVECSDCHSHHYAQAGAHNYGTTATSARNLVSNPIKGVSGWAVNYTGLANFVAPAAANYSTVASATYEYQICFKCHSARAWSFGTAPAGLTSYYSSVYSTGTATFTNGSTTVTGSGTAWAAGMVGSWIRRGSDAAAYRIAAVASGTSLTITPAYAGATGSGQPYTITLATGLALEFSPNNRSGHPVVTGLNNYPNSAAPKALQAVQLSAPWNTNVGTQTMMCSDCHNTDAGTGAAQGPHGSASQFMLRGANAANWPDVTLSNRTRSWCVNCHPLSTSTNTNSVHTRSDHASQPCYACHIVIPHGGKMSRLIGDRDTMPARYAFNNTLTTMQMQSFTKKARTSYTESDCRAACQHTGGTENW